MKVKRTSHVPPSISVPSAIFDRTAPGCPCRVSSGTKNPPLTNQSPTVMRLKTMNPSTVSNG